MHRNMTLIRLILEHMKELDEFGLMPRPKINGYTKNEIAYHVRLCSDAGYLILQKGTKEVTPIIIRMTWCGHKALEKTD